MEYRPKSVTGTPNPDDVARCVVAHWASLAASAGDDGFSVVAGVVAVDGDSLTVVACASGCKCVGALPEDDRGFRVRDAHAEVLARRGLVAVLLEDVLRLATPGAAAPVLLAAAAPDGLGRAVALKQGVALHFYCSAAPCGDAAIYELDGGAAAAYTGAKLGDWRRESDPQRLGATRLKPGRSDVAEGRRTCSLSCTDKLCQWWLHGLEGQLLSHWVQPIRLASIVVGLCDARATQEAQLAALRRGLQHRAAGFARRLGFEAAADVELAVTAVVPACALRRASSRPAPLGVAWWLGCADPDILLAAAGVRRGATAKAIAAQRLAARSRLARAALFEKFEAIIAVDRPRSLGENASIDACKAAAPGRAARLALRALLLEDFPASFHEQHRKRRRADTIPPEYGPTVLKPSPAACAIL
ncbi:hypothetical protein M885DRAFT_523098 [Pelagophyceae sp. CCMP2097]|nr:hypothetical protein M885DRAFT_523098 [Pelagophyceae sp. CCMP2097]